MSKEFSVYNNPMGGEAPMPPPKPQSVLLFKSDSYLSASTFTTATKLEDAIRMEHLTPKQRESLIKLLLSTLFPKWDWMTGKTKKLPKEKVIKPSVKTTPKIVPKAVKIFKAPLEKVDKTFEKGWIRLSKIGTEIGKPVFKGVDKLLTTIGTAIDTGVERLTDLTQKFVLTPLKKTFDKVMAPIERAAQKLGQRIERTFYRLEREGERIIEFMAPPVKKVAHETTRLLKKLASPLRKTKIFIERRFAFIQKLQLPRIFNETLIKPFKNTLQSLFSPIVQSAFKLGAPLLVVGMQLLNGGKTCYFFLTAIAARVAKKANTLLDRLLRKLTNWLTKLFKILLATIVRLYKLFLKVPQAIGRAIVSIVTGPFKAFSRLTLRARGWVRL